MYVTQSLHRALQQKPDAAAIRSGGNERTFREFADRVARLAAGLCGLGMRPGDRVALLGLNSAHYLECQLAVLWGGGVLNPCNIRWSPAELAYSLNDSESSLLIVDAAFAPCLASLRRDVASLGGALYAAPGPAPSGSVSAEALIAAHAPMPDACRRGDDLAGIFYTGGTTGFPKGVMLSHTNICSSALALVAAGLAAPGGTCLHSAPMFHLADLGFSMAHCMLGNTHAFVSVFRPDDVLQTIEAERVTHTLLVPTMIHALVERLAAGSSRDLGSLRSISYGASPMSEELLDRAMSALPHVQFQQAYGMTELAPVATVNPPESYTQAGRARGRHRAVGRAALCVELRIVDPEDRDVPRGTVGEVVVRGPNVMLGYWKNPSETQRALRGGWMHTGDAGYMDEDGFLYLVDRIKDMIISGGENVYSAEVENVLATHPAVGLCAIIGVPDVQWGERVHAVVVLRTGSVVNADELIAHCRARIAGYKCPRTVEFLESLPMSGAGKILKTELRKRFRTA